MEAGIDDPKDFFDPAAAANHHSSLLRAGHYFIFVFYLLSARFVGNRQWSTKSTIWLVFSQLIMLLHVHILSRTWMLANTLAIYTGELER
jgi:isoprenylcysteine carboxyl methyltransferase (ICMT) family protein YpbQ